MLDDGSTIPALPSPGDKEVRDMVLGKIRAKGLADGFEDAVRSLAVRNPSQITVLVSREADWRTVEKALGIDKVELNPDHGVKMGYSRGGKPVRYNIEWIKSGWLRFGVDSGRVKMIGCEFGGFIVQYPEYIAAEDVEGGRSDPDPSKALKKAKVRPANAPLPAVETLEKLGRVREIKVVPYAAKKEPASAKKIAAELAGRPLYPDVVDAARKCKGQREVLEFLVTPSNAMTLSEMTDIMGENTRMHRDDSRTFPGTTVKWYNYYWLELGIVDGQVKKVRIHCQTVPKEL
jgi:hypothetical protein